MRRALQVARLAEYLNGKGVKAANINFPNRTTAVGSLINSYLQSGQELGTRRPWRVSSSALRLCYSCSAAFTLLLALHPFRDPSLASEPGSTTRALALAPQDP